MICVICGAEFKPKKEMQKTCSAECRKTYRNSKQREYMRKACAKKRGETFVPLGGVKKCPVCGKEFIKKYKNQVCCSDECQQERTRRKKREYEYHFDTEQKQQQDKPLKPAICHNCGEQFTPNYAKEKFCSDKCRFQFFHLEE